MKRWISIFMVCFMLIGLSVIGSSPVAAAEEYGWVLVDTHVFPVSKYFSAGAFWIYEGKSEEKMVEARITANDKNPPDFHARYTWTDLPTVVGAKEKVTIRMSQEVISYNVGKYSLAFRPTFKADVPDLELGYGTAGSKDFTGVYEDGKVVKTLSLSPGYITTGGELVYNGDESFQKSTWVDLTIEFYDQPATVGTKKSFYVGLYAGAPGTLGTRYTYEWKALPAQNQSVEVFESGLRISWQPAAGLGYRVFRSTEKSALGVSVTDFYITSTAFVDANAEDNTFYYYTVKPVIAEAKPLENISEKLGNPVATFEVKTLNTSYKPGLFKNFIILQLDSPNMSVNGMNQEVDPGRGTAPMIISGRTMVPIRAVVEAMNGNIEWEGASRKITLNARGNTVEMWLDRLDIIVNGVAGKMDVAPISKNDRTYVPIRFAAENLNCKVEWINSTKEAVVVYEE